MYPFKISATGHWKDAIVHCVQQGIDSRLEAFTSSTFKENVRGPLVTLKNGSKMCVAIALDCEVSEEDLPILIRRLMELAEREDEKRTPDGDSTPLGWESEELARDIVHYILRDAAGLPPDLEDDDEPQAAIDERLGEFVEDYVAFGYADDNYREVLKSLLADASVLS